MFEPELPPVWKFEEFSMRSDHAALVIFVITLGMTFVVALLARRQAVLENDDDLAGRRLNRWLVGLSAGTTANSGFIVSAAVGLGYTTGLQAILLPFAWLLGDVVFWYFFPARINALGRESRATTLSKLLRWRLTGPYASAIAVLSACIILICLAQYTSAQWIAGQKFLSAAFGFSDVAAVTIVGASITAYSCIGGFRGSIYTDAFQAVIRIIGTVAAIIAIVWFAMSDQASFAKNVADAGASFVSILPGGTLLTAIGFVVGFAAAAVGFGLGQPQIISRYLAGSSPAETRSAWWIYIAFVQFTWMTMTIFGIVLRGVMPGIADPEAGLIVFFHQTLGSALTGLIVADIFATIASTSNGLLVAMAQAANNDILPRLFRNRIAVPHFAVTTATIGLLTMMGALLIRQETVLNLALSSASLMGAGLASPVMIKVLRWKHTASSLFLSLFAGLVAASVWNAIGLDAAFNKAGIGIAVGLLTNWWTLTMMDRLKSWQHFHDQSKSRTGRSKKDGNTRLGSEV